MVWYNPLSWFSRNANAIAQKASTNVLKSALRNYIKAVNNLPNKNNAYIYGLMMKTANGANASYKNRFTNGIAKIVAASRRGIVQAANAVVNGAPEGPAAVAVNNATRKINNLAKPVPVNAPIPTPVGLAGKVFGVTKGKNQNNNASRTNINYITKIAKNQTGLYRTNGNRVQAALAANPTLNFAALMNKTNNANVKRLLKLLANVPAAARPAVAAAAVNVVPNTGEALTSLFSEPIPLKTLLNKNIKTLNPNKIANLVAELKRKKGNATVSENNKKLINAKLAAIRGLSGANNFMAGAEALGLPNSRKGQVAGVNRNVYYHKNARNGYFIKNANGYYKKLSNGNANVGTWPAPTNTRRYEYDSNDGFEAIGTSTN